MKSLEELKKLKEAAGKEMELRDSNKRYRVLVGMGTCGIAAGARPVLNRLVEEAAKHDYPCVVSQTGCIGLCKYEPIVEVFDREGDKTTYVYVDAEKAAAIFDSHILHYKVAEEYTLDAEERKGK